MTPFDNNLFENHDSVLDDLPSITVLILPHRNKETSCSWETETNCVQEHGWKDQGIIKFRSNGGYLIHGTLQIL